MALCDLIPPVLLKRLQNKENISLVLLNSIWEIILKNVFVNVQSGREQQNAVVVPLRIGYARQLGLGRSELTSSLYRLRSCNTDIFHYMAFITFSYT